MRPLSILLFCSLAIAHLARASDNHYLDSLWQVYRTDGLGEHDRLLLLHDIVDETRYENADSARVLAEELLRLAVAQHDTVAMALAHRDFGALADFARDNDAALKAYHEAYTLYATRPDTIGFTGMAATLQSMGAIYKNLGRLDTALVIYRTALELDQRIGNRNGLMFVFGSMGRLHEIQGDNDSALYYYAESGNLAEALNEQRMIAASLGNRANVYQRIGQVGPAIDFAYKCLAIMERIGNDRGIATALTTVASLKAQLGETDVSLALLRRSHALYTKVGYRQGMMTSGRSIGSDLLSLGQPDSAILWLERATALEREFEARDILAPTLNTLAKAYRGTGRNADAAKLLEEALTIGRELKDAPTEAATLALLGRVALDRSDAAGAIAHCTEGLRVARTAAALSERGDNCECLYLAHKAKGDGLAAVRYLEEFHTVRDSVDLEKSTRELTQRDLLYTFGKQQLADSLRYAEAAVRTALEADVHIARARTRYLATGGVILFVVAGLITYFIVDRKRRKTRFEKDAAQLETQALRSQMNPHFIFNALNSINAFVQKNDSDRASAYLGKFARLMRLVLENSRQAEVPLKDDLEALDLYLNLERARSRDASGGEKFDYTITVDPQIDQEETFVPPLVIQPFVENAIWHGMAGKETKGLITLSVTRRGDELIMAIEDDGVGRTAKKIPEEFPDSAAAHRTASGEVPDSSVPGATRRHGSGTEMKKTSLATTITKARLDLVRKQKGKPAGFRIIDLAQGTRVEVSLPVGEAA